MARPITDEELVKLRAEGPWSEVYLILDNPNTVYTARATGTIYQDDWSVGFDNGATTLANCLPDMILLISALAYGGYEKGILRLRKAADDSGGGLGVFYLGADPSVEIEFGDYLTVINDFGLFAKHPLGSSVDVDVPRTDQFTSPIPVPVVNGRVRVIDADGVAKFDASLSWIPGGASLTYSWTFTGSASTTGTGTAIATATYATSGRHRWSLAVTGGGKTTTIYGFVYVLGVNLAPEDYITIDRLEGDESGWVCNVKMYSTPSIKPGARAIVYARDWYNGIEESLGPVLGAENILLAGWVIGETIVRDPVKDIVEFQIGGPLVVLSNIAATQTGLQDTSFPSDDPLTGWSTLAGLTAVKGLHFLINYWSTIAAVCDVSVENWGYPVHKLSTDGDSLLSQLDDWAGNAALTVRADRLGRIFIQRDGQLYTMLSRTANIPNVMTLTDVDWQDDLVISPRQQGEAASASAEGVIFSAGIITQIGGLAPGDQPARFGGRGDGMTELNLSLLSDALELAGLAAGAKNGPYDGGAAILAQNNRFIDITPRQFVTITQDGDTIRCFPRRISTPLLDGTGYLNAEIDLEAEGVEWPAVQIDYPGEGDPPVEPPPEPPTPPPDPPDDPIEPPEEPSETDAVVSVSADVRTTEDLDEASPTWTSEI